MGKIKRLGIIVFIFFVAFDVIGDAQSDRKNIKKYKKTYVATQPDTSNNEFLDLAENVYTRK